MILHHYLRPRYSRERQCNRSLQAPYRPHRLRNRRHPHRARLVQQLKSFSTAFSRLERTRSTLGRKSRGIWYERIQSPLTVRISLDAMLQPHNFMHNKLLVADQIVATGSFNLSNDAMGNAENVLLNPGCGNRRTIREIYSAFNGELRCHKRSGYVTEASTAWARRLNPKRPIREAVIASRLRATGSGHTGAP